MQLDRDVAQFIVVGLAGILAAISTAVLGNLKMTAVVLGCLAFAGISFFIVRRWGYRE